MNSRKEKEVIKRNAELKQQLAANVLKLKIEAGLEKVRAVALKMKKPADMLEVCKTISLQLQKLGVKEIRNVQTAIFYESKGAYMNYEYYAKHKKTFITETVYTNHKIAKAFASQMLKGKGEVYTTHIKGKKVKDWLAYQKTTNVFIDRFLEKANSLNYYWHSLGPVALGMSTYDPLNEDELNLFKRFLKVFELAYKRYMDIEQAMAQAREAKIETALEKVRARTMAMQKSEELAETSLVLFQQFKNLGETSEQISIGIFKEEENIMELYSTLYGSQWKEAAKVDLDEPVVMKKIHAGWKEQKRSLVIDITGKDLRKYNVYRKRLSNLEFKEDRWVIHIAFFSKGTIIFSTTEPHPQETIQLLERFAGVFEQTYTRFLDLKKAEAQARESNIELALERVRAKTMAMQKPSEFLDVINVVGEQFVILGFDIEWANFSANGLDVSNGIDVWNFAVVPGLYKTAQRLYIPYIDHPLFTIASAGLDTYHRTGKDFFVIDLNKKEKDRWMEHMYTRSVFKELPDEFKTIQYNKIGYTSSVIVLKDAWLTIGKFDSHHFTEEQNAILRRFANAFGQAYTRFLDLQKAEAQARESQIQLALERVRARTMAMQRSDELAEAATLVFQQFSSLGLLPEGSRVFFSLIDEDTVTSEVWTTKEDGILRPGSHRISLKANGHLIDVYESWKGRKSIYNRELTGSELTDYLKYIASVPYLKEDKMLQQLVIAPPDRLVFTETFFAQGTIGVIGVIPFSQESQNTLMRFGKVFEQTYTRFLDLQKAEAQTRESQIELGLERVRARAMAMQHSDELKELVGTVYNELTKLDLAFDRCLIWVMNSEDLSSRLWMANAESQPVNFYIPYHDNPPYLAFVKAWKDRNKRWQYDLHGQVKKEWDGYVFNQTEMKHLPEPVKKNMQAIDRVMFTASFHNFGCLQTAGPELLKEEQFDILNRFAKVFDLTYTRFNDLKQAEAQARESQIQLALERVRARTMAMQKSDELMETAVVLFDQLKQLGEHIERTIIGVMNEEERVVDAWATRPDGSQMEKMQKFPIDEPILMQKVYGAWRQQKKSIVIDLRGEELETYFQFLKSRGPRLKRESFGERRVENFVFFSKGMLGFISVDPNVPANVGLYERFAAVFDQTYIRFNDLKQAEEQARESQIQLALERVRARTMAMQHSDELKNAAALLFQQVKSLGAPAYSCGYNIWEKDDKEFTSWMSSQDGSIINGVPNIPLTEDANFIRYVESKQNGEQFFVLELRGERMQEHYEYLKTIPAFKAYFDYAVSVGFDLPETQIHHLANFSQGNLLFITLAPCPEFHDVFKRFAAVFEQTYTRFLDLQKSEAQAREAKIENALEKIRSRTMAMQRSEELPVAANHLFLQVQSLGIPAWSAGYCIWDEDKQGITLWMSSEGVMQPSAHAPLTDDPSFIHMREAYERGDAFHVEEVGGEALVTHYNYMRTLPVVGEILDSIITAGHPLPTFQIFHCAYFSQGFLLFITYEPVSEAHTIFKRFTNVFEQTYTRFLDLKKAEAQAREAKIETALERVRSNTMAMHHSEELKDVISVTFEQIKNLDIIIDSCIITLFIEGSDDLNNWVASTEQKYPHNVRVPYFKHPLFDKIVLAKNKPGNYFTIKLSQKENQVFYKHIIENSDFGKIINEDRRSLVMNAESNIMSFANFRYTGLRVGNFRDHTYTDEENNIILRFANVFEQTYTRFLDLQKAEAQAREARIEAALEKVRASTMAMQKSEDLSIAAFVLFQQFKGLGEEAERIFIATFDDDERWVDLWGTNQGGNQLNKLFRAPVDEPTVISKIISAWKGKAKSMVIDLTGDDLNKYVSFLKGAGIPVTEGVMNDRRVQTIACFSKGVIGLTTHEPRPQESIQLLERFAGVFDLTYTRFLDLTVAETKAHEARIEVALERVRARALAMQQPEELKDVAQVLRNEMGLLGVEELETSSIYIHPDNSEKVECWYALKDPAATEKRMVSDHFDLDLNDTWVGKEMQKFYTSNDKQTSIVMQGANRKEWIEYCYKHSPVFSGFYGETIPDRTYHLFKFSHGYIGAAAPGEISNESWRLLSRAASVFSLAYSRFKDLSQARIDLVKLKEEKKRAEDALSDLQSAQKQLVQAEKMASLGELTAGIAHEIQNPLNFVNNFSDVSNELLDEMKAELEKGNAEEAKLIAVDVKENLEKILHHGKRADAIVKGMLQHSRTSSGQKELTDINVLAEEYLRLAYHGLRAKDKFFNAKFETVLDPSITKINIVPQEIGRVILNLINNSFYAVSEKKRNVSNGYEPSVTVSTKKLNDKIEIRVVDNGNGIPQKVLDKIFQPFFTTKPTGQGTGLGLSLSYDIVTKGHDGEIKVETKEGEGSAFTISLPMK